MSVSAAVEREGRSLSSVTCRLEQDGKLIGLGVAAYSRPWEGPLLDDSPMPEVEPPTSRCPRPSPSAQEPPPFLDRMDMQHRFGETPFPGSSTG